MSSFPNLPWLGEEFEFVRGIVSYIPPGPSVKEDIESDCVFSPAGINSKTTAFHFIDVESKHAARFKYMESISGWDQNHIRGEAYVS